MAGAGVPVRLRAAEPADDGGREEEAGAREGAPGLVDATALGLGALDEPADPLELDGEGAARVLGISTTACSTRLSRALAKLEKGVSAGVAA